MSYIFNLQEKTSENVGDSGYENNIQYISLKFYNSPSPNNIFNTNVILKNNNLYVEIQPGLMEGFSREAFVALLEYAEEVLICKNVVVQFPNDCLNRANLIRIFMFMGFFVIPPGNDLILPLKQDNIYMVYKIE